LITMLRRALLSLSLLALTACSAGAQPAPPSGGILTEEKMQHDGRERRFLINDYSGGKPAPVVFVLHGGGGHPENAPAIAAPMRARTMSTMSASSRR
jgi:poly(3-hydroxybutyrate) depolymerase